MTPKKKNNSGNQLSSAVQALQQQVGSGLPGIGIDDLPDMDNSAEERKLEILTKLSETIKQTLKDLQEKGKQGLTDYIFTEKIALLERTKSAVETFLIQILSSPNSSGKAYEALSMIIKVNAELLKDLSDEHKDNNQLGNNQSNIRSGETTTIVVAPSEAMLDNIMKQRHKHQSIPKDKITTVEDNNDQ